MNSEEINEMFEAFEKSDNKKLLELAEIEVNDDKIEEYTRNNSNEILSRLMAKIENGDYRYFLQSKNDPLKKFIYLKLMIYSKLIKNLKIVLLNEFEIQESGLSKLDILEIIEDKQRRAILGIDYTDCIARIIKDTEYYDYIKNLIDDREKRKKVGLNEKAAIELILFLNNQEYIEKVLDSEEIREGFEIKQNGVLELLESINSIEYIERFTENKEKCYELGLTEYDVYSLRSKCNIIKRIMRVRNFNYVKNTVLENENRRRELGLNKTDILGIIKDRKEMAYIKDIIENPELLGKLGLDSSDVPELMEFLKDPDFIEGILENKEKTNRIGLDQDVLKTIEACFLGNEIPFNYINIKKSIKIEEKIKLPSNMTKGMEIESEGKNSRLIRMKMNAIHTKWIATTDSSLKEGIEIISPVPKAIGNNREDENGIKLICGMLIELGQNTSERCGAHVHIGADYLTTTESWINLLEIWGNTEKIIYIISNKEGEIPRYEIRNMAKPFSGELEDALKTENSKIKDEVTLKHLVKEIQKDRRYGINFKNLGNEKNTIEFRISNGTLDAKTWIENINLYGGVVKAAEDIAMIQLKKEEDRTDDEKNKLNNFERLKNPQLSEKEKLEILLYITISEEDRKTYEERYNVNSELLKQAPEIQQLLYNQTTKRSNNN